MLYEIKDFMNISGIESMKSSKIKNIILWMFINRKITRYFNLEYI